MSGAKKPARLGKGLGALLGEYLPPEGAQPSQDGIRVVPIARIAPNPFQPRREFAPGFGGQSAARAAIEVARQSRQASARISVRPRARPAIERSTDAIT